ncbi:glycan biosynthesis hexose transferase WsfD [Qaidamihabitans albus]|uniref:glycan biosynthesis hexose transferase WsfD n=1 Tax=Qaidamihabitans albus TaxID=2795733 RepID=UPI0018F1B590|nr:hypothetical protein [Qaidamihabitans albus]
MSTALAKQAPEESDAAEHENGTRPSKAQLVGWRAAELARETITRMVRWMTRHRAWTAAAIGGLWATIAVVRMLWPVPVGLADAGDGHHLMCQVGAAPVEPNMGGSSGYLHLHWPSHRYYGETCGVPSTGETYWSSQLILLRFTGWFGSMLGLPAGVDLRVLAVLCALLVGVGVGLLVLVLPPSLSPFKRILVAGLAGLVMVDSGIARFYASSYSEPAALLGLFLLCPALLWLLSRRRYTWGALLAVTGVGAFAVLAKTQMIVLLPALIVVLLLRPSLPEHWHATSPLKPVRGNRTLRRSRATHWLWVRAPALALIAALTVVGCANVAGQPKRYAEIHSYSQIFTTMLPMSPDPESDLRWFGLDPSLARGAGTNIYSPDTVAYDPAYAGFTEAVTDAKVAMFYLSHPGRLVKLLDTGLTGMAGYGTETYMANYPEDAGKPPYAKESRVAVISWFAGAYRAIPWFFVLQWLLVLAVSVSVVRRYRRSPRRQSIGVLGLFLLGSMTAQFWAVMMSDGKNEMFKHMMPADLLMFLTLPLLLAAWYQRRRNIADTDSGGPSTASTAAPN